MSYQVCPSFLFNSFCAYSNSCPFLHIPIEKTCHSFSNKNFCDFYPICKYLHVNSSLNYIPQPQDSLTPKTQKKLRKLLRKSVNFSQNRQGEAVFTVNLSKEFVVYEQIMRSYLKNFAETLEIPQKLSSLSVNLNANFLENLSMVLSILHEFINNIEICKVFLTNVCMNDAFFVEILGFFNKMPNLRGFQLSFQNCVLQNTAKTSQNLDIFAEKLKKLKEFSFIINYDYSLENNRGYQDILQRILSQNLENLTKLELFLGFSSFKLFEALENLRVFKKIETFVVSLLNFSEKKQAKALGFLLKAVKSARTFCINILNNNFNCINLDKNRRNKEKSQVFCEETASSLENLRELQNLESFSLIFEEKVAKNPKALELFLSFLSKNRSLKVLELDLSYTTSELDCTNLWPILIKNCENLTKLSIKLNNSLLSESFSSNFYVIFGKLRNLREICLDLEFSRISDLFLKKLASSLGFLEFLQSVSLNLCRNRITERGCRSLGFYLKKLTILEKLFVDLSFNTVLDAGLQSLVCDLPKNLRNLAVLLQRNAISAAGVLGLCKTFEEKLSNLRRLYVDFSNNPGVERQGDRVLLEIFEKLCGNSVSFVEGGWESDYFDEEISRKRKHLLRNLMIRKKILAYQLRAMSQKLRKCFRKEVATQIAREKLAKIAEISQ